MDKDMILQEKEAEVRAHCFLMDCPSRLSRFLKVEVSFLLSFQELVEKIDTTQMSVR